MARGRQTVHLWPVAAAWDGVGRRCFINGIDSLDSFFTDGQVHTWPLVKRMVRNVIDDMHTSVPSISLLPILSHPVTCLPAIYQYFLMTFTPTRSPRAICNVVTACIIPAIIPMKTLHSVGAKKYIRGAKAAQSEAKASNTHIVARPLLFQIGMPSVAILIRLTEEPWMRNQKSASLDFPR